MDETKALSEPSTALPSAWIERLFARLAAIYGNKFSDMWAGQSIASVRDMWAAEMSGLTASQIRAGLMQLRSKHPTWPPTLYEFMDLCKPSAAEIDPESAFHQAVLGTYARREGKFGEWSHRAVYWAAIDVTAFDVLNLTWPQIRSRWTRALNSRMADPNLPEIPEAPKRLPAPPRVAKGDSKIIDELAAKLTSTRRDYRAWVRKILERHAAGDKTLPDIAYRMALNSENIR